MLALKRPSPEGPKAKSLVIPASRLTIPISVPVYSFAALLQSIAMTISHHLRVANKNRHQLCTSGAPGLFETWEGHDFSRAK